MSDEDGKSFKQGDIEYNLVDDAYVEKMTAFEMDCADGQGEPMACHHVGEFFSVVRNEHDRAAKVYANNCYNVGFGPSCFNLGKLHLAGKGVPQNDKKGEYEQPLRAFSPAKFPCTFHFR
jgi:hypothetical protein